MILAVAAAFACGGPYMMTLDQPLLDPATMLGDLLPDPEDGEGIEAAVDRFLYASAGVAPEAYEPLIAHLETRGEVAPSPVVRDAMATMGAALARGSRGEAVKAAQAAVEAILDLPAPLAAPHQEDLQLAVELIEVQGLLSGVNGSTLVTWFGDRQAPAMRLPASFAPVAAARVWLDGDHADAPDPKSPRLASMEWALQNDGMRARIPDGWSADDIRSSGTADFEGLQAEADAWLRRHPDHPLADYVRLRKVRLHHLAGEADAAWAALVEMLPRHPHRVANEMRFLLRAGTMPSRVSLRALPPEIAAGLMAHVAFTRDDWDDVWARAATSPGRIAIEERLFYVWIATASGKLPDRFPADAAHPSDTWARLRATILLRNGRWSQAEAQLAVTTAAPDVTAAGAARVLLARGDWLGAIRTPGLDPATTAYFIRVLASEETQRALVDDADPTLRFEARLALASRAIAASRDWSAAAAWMRPVDPARADKLAAVAKLEADRSAAGRLALARHLRAQGGALLLGNTYDDVVWYRSLPRARPPSEEWRADRSPISLTHAQEWAATQDFLQRNFVTWYALSAYAEWLSMQDLGRLRGAKRAEAHAVLAEADAVYNLLLNYGSSDWWAWGQILPTSAPAVTIRAAGVVLKDRR